MSESYSYLTALRVAFPPYQPPPRFQPDSPLTTWVEPCRCAPGEHRRIAEQFGLLALARHLNDIYHLRRKGRPHGNT